MGAPFWGVKDPFRGCKESRPQHFFWRGRNTSPRKREWGCSFSPGGKNLYLRCKKGSVAVKKTPLPGGENPRAVFLYNIRAARRRVVFQTKKNPPPRCEKIITTRRGRLSIATPARTGVASHALWQRDRRRNRGASLPNRTTTRRRGRCTTRAGRYHLPGVRGGKFRAAAQSEATPVGRNGSEPLGGPPKRFVAK